MNALSIAHFTAGKNINRKLPKGYVKQNHQGLQISDHKLKYIDQGAFHLFLHC